jgi:hypothetical protein
MYKSKNEGCLAFKKIKILCRWFIKIIYLIIIAMMLGFSNAYYNETKNVNDIKKDYKQEQVVED